MFDCVPTCTPESFAKCAAAHNWGERVSPICTIPEVKGNELLLSFVLLPLLLLVGHKDTQHTHGDGERRKEREMGGERDVGPAALCKSSHMINSIKRRADGDLCFPPLPSGRNNVFNGSHLGHSDLYFKCNHGDRARDKGQKKLELRLNFCF